MSVDSAIGTVDFTLADGVGSDPPSPSAIGTVDFTLVDAIGGVKGPSAIGTVDFTMRPVPEPESSGIGTVDFTIRLVRFYEWRSGADENQTLRLVTPDAP
jgi:hypothetical protein